MKLTNLERYLQSYGKYVVQQSRTNLTKAKKNVSKNLYNSIRYKVEFVNGEFSVDFYMNDYGMYVDKGVSGKSKIQDYVNYDNKKVESPFKYTTKGPPIDILSKWIKARGIKPTGFKRGRSTKTGQFISGFAYLISRKILREGIKSTSFFQRPISLASRKFGVGILRALKEDVLTVFSKQIKTSVS